MQFLGRNSKFASTGPQSPLSEGSCTGNMYMVRVADAVLFVGGPVNMTCLIRASQASFWDLASLALHATGLSGIEQELDMALAVHGYVQSTMSVIRPDTDAARGFLFCLAVGELAARGCFFPQKVSVSH